MKTMALHWSGRCDVCFGGYLLLDLVIMNVISSVAVHLEGEHRQKDENNYMKNKY